MKFASLGRTEMLLKSIRACLSAGHELVLVGTAPSAPEYAADEKEFRRLAAQHGCPYVSGPNLGDPKRLATLARCGAAVGISMNWPHLIGRDILDLFPSGIINAHAGDLPRFRGNACPNWAILSGERSLTVSLHQMDEHLDSGPVLLKRSMTLTPRTYVGDAYEFLAKEIPAMFVECLDGIEKGNLSARPQDGNPANSLRAFPRVPADSYLDWTRPAEELDRLVRASSEPFAGAYTFLDCRKLTIWRAYAEELLYPYLGRPGQVAEIRTATGEVVVLAGKGALVLEEIAMANGRRDRAAAFIKSTRTRLGLDPVEEVLRLRARLARKEKEVAAGRRTARRSR